MKLLRTNLLLLILLVASCQSKDIIDENSCVVCDRMKLFHQCKVFIGNKIWPSLNDKQYTAPLLYYSDSSTFLLSYDSSLISQWNSSPIACSDDFTLRILDQRIDERPFIMENQMDFSDSLSPYFYRPIMQCSDVEGLIRLVPDFEKTEDWLQLVMHEYFHSYQFNHKNTINYLADSIKAGADTLNTIYNDLDWFRDNLKEENQLLLSAIKHTNVDSVKYFSVSFIELRNSRRKKYQDLLDQDISRLENFWEMIEGTARYSEYYMAGYFDQIETSDINKCDTLFNEFMDFKGIANFENEPEFRTRTEIMPAYYYVTGFNLCRLLDKLNIEFKENLFKDPNRSLYYLLSESL